MQSRLLLTAAAAAICGFAQPSWAQTNDDDYASKFTTMKSTYPTDITTLLGSDVTAWTDNGGYAKNNGDQHWSGASAYAYYEQTSAEWSQSSWSHTATKTISLPAGKYSLVASGRAAANTTLTMSVGDTQVSFPSNGDTGYGIATDGTATKDASATYANNGKGRGWEWRYIEFELTNEGSVTVKFAASASANHNWCSFTDIQLLTVATNTAATRLVALASMNASVATAEALDVKTNVGDKPFQKPASLATAITTAITTAKSLADNSEATAEQLNSQKAAIDDAITAFNDAELNKPAEDAKFNLALTNNFNHKGKFLTVSDKKSEGNYSLGYNETAISYKNQSFSFKHTGTKNTYYLYFEGDDGKTRYITTGTTYSGNTSQLRVSENESDALAIVVATGTAEGVNTLYNPKANLYIGSNGDTGFFSANQYHDFSITEAKKYSVTLKVSEGTKWATFIAPFEVELPQGVKAYSCAAIGANGTTLAITEATGKLTANKPYILYSETAVNQTMEGYASAKVDEYADGLLVGEHKEATVPNATTNYVLQNHDGRVAFYQVQSADVKCIAAKAYLKVPASSGAKSFSLSLDGDVTAISTISAASSQETAHYNAAGASVQKAAKGLQIVKLADGRRVKQIVK